LKLIADRPGAIYSHNVIWKGRTLLNDWLPPSFLSGFQRLVFSLEAKPYMLHKADDSFPASFDQRALP
jgi:hypothetical protein